MADPRIIGPTLMVTTGGNAVMTVSLPGADPHLEWSLRYGDPVAVRFLAASVIESFDYLLSSNINMTEATRRLRVLRAAVRETPSGVALPAIDESKLPPRPAGSNDANTDPDSPLVRYGRASKDSGGLLEPMADGYWTPWHIANELLRAAIAGVDTSEQPRDFSLSRTIHIGGTSGAQGDGGTAGVTGTPRRQYFYRVAGCPAVDGKDPACICWHDEGTGPWAQAKLGDERLEWRTHGVQPSQAPSIRYDVLQEIATEFGLNYNAVCRCANTYLADPKGPDHG